MLPGQLANRWAVEICLGLGGFRQAGLEIEAKVTGFEHRLGDRSVCLVVSACRHGTGLARQFVVRHLACIGTSGQRLKRQMPKEPGSVVARRFCRAALQLADDRGVSESGRVTEVATLGDVAQQPAHDLAAAGLG